jgi:multidrug transporter EmrE-like cation transporter
MVSLGYILSLIWSKLFFNEMITKMKIAGMALILAGIVFVSFGSR